MRTIKTLAVSALCCVLALPAAAEKLSLESLSTYLDDLKTAQTDFTQFNADGSRSTGRIFIKRPWKIRFEYDPPDEILVLAHSLAVAIFDGKSNLPPETYPLNRTPLSLILGPEVNLQDAKMVVDHGYQDGVTTVFAQDPKNPEYGQIELRFSNEPVTLREWVIHDAVGGQTRVVLGDLDRDVELKNSIFNIDLHSPNSNR